MWIGSYSSIFQFIFQREKKKGGNVTFFFFAFKIFIDMCTGLFLRRKINVWISRYYIPWNDLSLLLMAIFQEKEKIIWFHCVFLLFFLKNQDCSGRNVKPVMFSGYIKVDWQKIEYIFKCDRKFICWFKWYVF